jgi:hypothetical protein
VYTTSEYVHVGQEKENGMTFVCTNDPFIESEEGILDTKNSRLVALAYHKSSCVCVNLLTDW